MKKIILILLLAVLIVTQVFAIETGTVTLSYENGTVIYNDTQTFYEFDVMGYIDGGSDTNVFKEGQFYVEYNTTVFGDSSSLNIVSTTLMGPLATIPGVVYWIVNDGKNTASNAFSVTLPQALIETKRHSSVISFLSISRIHLQTIFSLQSTSST